MCFYYYRLVEECSKEAMKVGAHYFAIVYYGECWALLHPSDLFMTALRDDDCANGDNSKLPCGRFGGARECVGVSKTAFVYNCKSFLQYHLFISYIDFSRIFVNLMDICSKQLFIFHIE